MTKSFALLIAVTTLVACGGSTDTADTSQAGSPTTAGNEAGGNGSAGGGGSSSAGAGGIKSGTSGSGGAGLSGGANGGSANAGTSSGGISSGGVSSGGSAGAVSVDPRCPATAPDGVCAEDGVNCEYSVLNSCLCYPSSPNSFATCTQVDPTCPSGSGGTGGASPAPPPEGSGGIHTKIAAPSHRRCTCTNDAWSCVYGI